MKGLSRTETETGQRRYEYLLSIREATFTRNLAREKNRFIRAYADVYRYAPLNINSMLIEHRDRVMDILGKHYEAILPRFGKDQLRNIKRDVKRVGDDNFWLDMVLSYIELNGLAKATTIAETTLEDVQKAIALGAAEGLGQAPIAKNILKVTALSPWRARTIARTETHAASNYAFEETARQASGELGITLYKYWIPAIDERTREAHASMRNADGIPLNEKFMVGGELLSRPGDPAGRPANIINCRCRLVHREREFEIE